MISFMKKCTLCIFTLTCSTYVHELRAGLLDFVGDRAVNASSPSPVSEDLSVVDVPYSAGVEDPILMPQEPETFCDSLTAILKKTMDPLPLADWLNATQLEFFYQPTFHSILSQDDYFNSIYTLERYNLVIEPYGFNSSSKLDGKNLKLSTLGATLAANVTSKDCWILGLGIGYSHSNLDWGNLAKEVKINSVYFGPQATYLLNRGFIQLMLVGVYNMYDGDRDPTRVYKTAIDHTGWDLFAKLGWGIDFETCLFSWPPLFIRPNIDLSYLGAFQDAQEEEFSDELKTRVKNGYSDFFRSRLAVEFWKEFCKIDRGFLIPSLSIGWIYMQPISTGKKSFDCEGSRKVSIKNYPTSNQLYLGAKLTAMHRRGLLLSLGFDATIATLYAIYSGSVRFELDW